MGRNNTPKSSYGRTYTNSSKRYQQEVLNEEKMEEQSAQKKRKSTSEKNDTSVEKDKTTVKKRPKKDLISTEAPPGNPKTLAQEEVRKPVEEDAEAAGASKTAPEPPQASTTKTKLASKETTKALETTTAVQSQTEQAAEPPKEATNSPKLASKERAEESELTEDTGPTTPAQPVTEPAPESTKKALATPRSEPGPSKGPTTSVIGIAGAFDNAVDRPIAYKTKVVTALGTLQQVTGQATPTTATDCPQARVDDGSAAIMVALKELTKLVQALPTTSAPVIINQMMNTPSFDDYIDRRIRLALQSQPNSQFLASQNSTTAGDDKIPLVTAEGAGGPETMWVSSAQESMLRRAATMRLRTRVALNILYDFDIKLIRTLRKGSKPKEVNGVMRIPISQLNIAFCEAVNIKYDNCCTRARERVPADPLEIHEAEEKVRKETSAHIVHTFDYYRRDYDANGDYVRRNTNSSTQSGSPSGGSGSANNNARRDSSSSEGSVGNQQT